MLSRFEKLAQSFQNTEEDSLRVASVSRLRNIMDSGRRGVARTPLALNGVICTLEELCTKKVLEGSLLSCGRKIEERARVIWRQSNPDSTSSDGRPKRRKRRSSTTILTETLDELDLRSDSDLDFYTQTDYFLHQSSKCRDFLKTHLSSCTLDNLVSEVQQLSHRSGFFFALSSLCSDRLSHLPISDLRKVVIIKHLKE